MFFFLNLILSLKLPDKDIFGSLIFAVSFFLLTVQPSVSGEKTDSFTGIAFSAANIFQLQEKDTLNLPVKSSRSDTSSVSDSLKIMAGDSLLYYGKEFSVDSVFTDTLRPKTLKVSSPKGAMWRSLLFPGWGQFYNERYLKSLIIGGTESAFIYGIYIQEKRRRDAKDKGLIDEQRFYLKDRKKFTWWLAGTMIYSALDAYVDAQLMDFNVSEDLAVGIGSGFIFLRVKL